MATIAGYMPWAQTLFLAGCLIWCISSDLFQRKIPNRAIVLLLLGWLVLSLLAITGVGHPRTASVKTILGALPGTVLVFVVGFLLFLTGRLGAGDVKMMSVLCLWVGAGNQVVFIMVTALAGGVLALMLPLLNMVPASLALGIDKVNRLLRINITSPTVLPADLSQGLPYGIAIAFGAAYILIWPLF